MSRVEPTVRVPGDVTSSTAQNDNCDAWDAATADINDENVQQEGLDHRSFADQVVEVLDDMGGGYVFESTGVGTSGAGSSTVPAVLNALDAKVTGMVVATGTRLVIRCSALIKADNTAALSVLTCFLLISSNGGATWSTVAGTSYPFKGPDNTAVGALVPGWCNYDITYYHAAGNGTFSYAFGFTSTTENSTPQNCVMFAQITRT